MKMQFPRLLSALLFVTVFFPMPGVGAEDAELPLIQASDAAALEAAEGRDVIVEGVVLNIGYSPAGGVRFLNFGARDSGFTAVIFRNVAGRFEDGFDKYKRQNVRIRGKLEKFREGRMQIRITDPGQIEIVNAAP